MIQFMRYRYLYYVLSALFLVPGLLSLVLWGIRPSIDFTGGTLLEIEVNQPYQSKLNAQVLQQIAQSNGVEVASIVVRDDHTYTLKAKPFDQTVNTRLQTEIASRSGVATVSALLTEKRFEMLGPILGAETLRRALAAVGVAAVGIFLFVWKQFKNKKYGICAILAMLHDTLIVLGIFSLLGKFMGVEVDTLFMTALLTVLSFSVHDTIVVYDRIRESIHKMPGIPYETLINKAINETLGRSVNNSVTIIFMLLALWLLGGETTQWFVFALLIGTISGTYSSSFVAAPLLVEWEKWLAKKK